MDPRRDRTRTRTSTEYRTGLEQKPTAFRFSSGRGADTTADSERMADAIRLEDLCTYTSITPGSPRWLLLLLVLYAPLGALLFTVRLVITAAVATLLLLLPSSLAEPAGTVARLTLTLTLTLTLSLRLTLTLSLTLSLTLTLTRRAPSR